MRITKNELVAANSKLATELNDMRAMYEQAHADRVRLLAERNEARATRGCQCIDCGGNQPSHSPDCAYMHELFGGSDVSPVSYPVEYRADTCKRIALKYRAMSRFNRALAQYEIKRDGEWVTAPSA